MTCNIVDLIHAQRALARAVREVRKIPGTDLSWKILKAHTELEKIEAALAQDPVSAMLQMLPKGAEIDEAELLRYWAICKAPATTLTDGSPVTEDHREIDPATGMQKGYVVLSVKELDKGYVRPIRSSYRHVGILGPRFELRDMTTEEQARHARHGGGYVKYETYPESEEPKVGRFWTQKQLDAIGQGCETVTTMNKALARTYASLPKFYDGTFCSNCGQHYPVSEFVWVGDGERVGS